MKTRGLPGTDLQITPVGIGTAPIGSGRDWPVWWGPQDEGEAIRTIHAALDRGVNWIDTAPFYGWGRAEEIVGRALREPGRDRRPRLHEVRDGAATRSAATGWISRPEPIRADLEASLRRCVVDYVDLLQFHDVDRPTADRGVMG